MPGLPALWERRGAGCAYFYPRKWLRQLLIMLISAGQWETKAAWRSVDLPWALPQESWCRTPSDRAAPGRCARALTSSGHRFRRSRQTKSSPVATGCSRPIALLFTSKSLVVARRRGIEEQQAFSCARSHTPQYQTGMPDGSCCTDDYLRYRNTRFSCSRSVGRRPFGRAVICPTASDWCGTVWRIGTAPTHRRLHD